MNKMCVYGRYCMFIPELRIFLIEVKWLYWSTYLISQVSVQTHLNFYFVKDEISTSSSAHKHIPVSLDTSFSGHWTQSKQQSAIWAWWNLLNPGVQITLHIEVGTWWKIKYALVTVMAWHAWPRKKHYYNMWPCGGSVSLWAWALRTSS